MHKAGKLASIGLIALTMGTATFSTLQTTDTTVAFAKKHKVHKAVNHVLSYTNLKGTTPYNANGGALYRNANLSKKVGNGNNYLQATLYAFKSARVQRPNGKIAVYYFVQNSANTVQGWIWHGNLTVAKSYDQENSDIRAMIAIVRTMSPDSQDDLLSNVSNIDPKAAYNDKNDKDKFDLGSVVSDMADDVYDNEGKVDIAAIGKAYDLFKGRFDTLTNNKLGALHDRYNEALNTDDAYYAAYNLGNALSDAIFDLQ